MGIEKNHLKIAAPKEESLPEIEVKPHPKEVADVDQEILAKMKARLEGVEFDELYDPQSRKIDQLSISREKIKLRRVFPTKDSIIEAFANRTILEGIKTEFKYEGIDYELLESISKSTLNSIEVNSPEFYTKFLFGEEEEP